MNGTTILANRARYGLYIQAIDEDVTLNKVKVTSSNGGIYAEHGRGGTVTLKDVTVIADGEHSAEWANAALAAACGAEMEVNGGTYQGKYAAYVYSSGGTITINGGEFIGMLQTDAGALIIKGGTFDHDPTAYVPEGYEAVQNGKSWTVRCVQQ